MPFNPLAPVTDYQSMLNRIFWFTTAAALVATWLLRRHIPELNSLLAEIDFTIEFGGDKIVPIPGGFLFPALAVKSHVARAFLVHESGVQRGSTGEKALCARDDLIGRQRRRELLKSRFPPNCHCNRVAGCGPRVPGRSATRDPISATG